MTDDFWVFGYGSLMWDPGFPYAECQPALLKGYHRSFCIYSRRYRGTDECPGLVLGLDRGGSCRGRAFRVAPDNMEETLAYLNEREMLHYVYKPKRLPVRLAGPRTIQALTYVADPAHASYAGGLSPEERAKLIRHGCGQRGTNIAYLENTVRHLDELGIREGELHDLLDAIHALVREDAA